MTAAAIAKYFATAPGTPGQMAIDLYERPRCSYCAKVRRTLEALDLEYDAHTVPAARFQRDEVEALTGQTSVPVLVDLDHDVTGMPESDDIVAYLERTYGKTAPP